MCDFNVPEVLAHLESFKHINAFENRVKVVEESDHIEGFPKWDGISCEACQVAAAIIVEYLDTGEFTNDSVVLAVNLKI